MYLDAIDIRILSKIADELVDIIYIYCLTWMCVGEGPGFDPRTAVAAGRKCVCISSHRCVRSFVQWGEAQSKFGMPLSCDMSDFHSPPSLVIFFFFGFHARRAGEELSHHTTTTPTYSSYNPCVSSFPSLIF